MDRKPSRRCCQSLLTAALFCTSTLLCAQTPVQTPAAPQPAVAPVAAAPTPTKAGSRSSKAAKRKQPKRSYSRATVSAFQDGETYLPAPAAGLATASPDTAAARLSPVVKRPAGATDGTSLDARLPPAEPPTAYSEVFQVAGSPTVLRKRYDEVDPSESTNDAGEILLAPEDSAAPSDSKKDQGPLQLKLKKKALQMSVEMPLGEP